VPASTDPDLDGLCALAAELLRTPIALIRPAGAEPPHWQGRHGDELGDPLGNDLGSDALVAAACTLALYQDGVVEVRDARADSRLPKQPRPQQAPGLRFFAGLALRQASGEALGTLCVIDHRPRRLGARQRAALQRLGRQALQLIELRHLRREPVEGIPRVWRRVALAAQHTSKIVLLLDGEGHILWMNPAFERSSGYRPEEALGRRPDELTHFDGSSQVAFEQLRQAVHGRHACQVQILKRARDGRLLWVDIDLQPLFDENGKFECFFSLETDISEIVRQREQARTLLEVLPAGVLLQSTEGRVLDANPAACRILGLAKNDLIGRDARSGHWYTVDANGRSLPDAQRPLVHVLATGQASPPQRLCLRNGQGEPRWLDMRCVPLHGPAGSLEAALTCFTDVSDTVRAKALLQTALDAADLEPWSWEPDANRWTLSPSLRARMHIDTIPGAWHARVDDEDLAQARHAMRALLRGEHSRYRTEFRLRMADGHWHWFAGSAAVAERSPDGRALRVSGVVLDIDERKRAEDRLQVAATTDALTGLPNRGLLADRLGRALAACQRRGHLGALIFLDLDQFKRVNDSHGHAAGDELLRKVTQRLLAALRAEDTLARMGGDELMVMLPNAGADAASAERAAHEVVRKLRAALDTPVQVDHTEYRVGASIGITVFPRGDAPSVDDLIREADTAMYAAKQAERGSTRVYEAAMREHLLGRLALERALHRAIEEDRIVLHLQGQWSADGRLAGVEALARWQDADRGMVPPASFIALAEETGLIVALGRRVVEHAAAITRRLRDAGLAVPLSLNISPRQFADPGFGPHLLQAVAAHGIAPADLQLELTEGMLADEASERLMNELADQGFRFSIDDFGTGWSNLVYLKRLPVDELKIDRAFVREAAEGGDDAALVLAILGIARRFRLRTVAEGVETQAQARFLLDAGCDRLQGWLYDRARPLEDLLAAVCATQADAAAGTP